MSQKCRINTSAPAFVGFRASAGMASGSTVGVGVGALLDDDAVGVGVGIWGSGSSALQPATRRSGTAQAAARVRRTDTNKPFPSGRSPNAADDEPRGASWLLPTTTPRLWTTPQPATTSTGVRARWVACRG